MSELTTGHELLLYGSLIIVTICALDWRESRFGPGNERRAPKRMPTERNDEDDERIGMDGQGSTRRQKGP